MSRRSVRIVGQPILLVHRWCDCSNTDKVFPTAGLGYGTAVSFCANGTACCGATCCITGIQPEDPASNNTSNAGATPPSISSSVKFSSVKTATLACGVWVPPGLALVISLFLAFYLRKRKSAGVLNDQEALHFAEICPASLSGK
jgi:hypothetical protein